MSWGQSNFWTEERTARLRQMFDDGLSCSEMAAELREPGRLAHAERATNRGRDQEAA
jgi:hypothetical protein